MRVTIVDNLPARRIEIYVSPKEGIVGNFYGRHMEWEEYEIGSTPEPTMIFDYEVWEAIMKEAFGTNPSEEVLKDTRNMRDRLLTMIESEWQARVEGK